MKRKTYETPKGTIVYWVNDVHLDNLKNLVFLPGLTADHRLFDQQILFFEEKANVLVWDAPGHNESRPFQLSFSLFDKARWLQKILEKEGFVLPFLIGQSMGGYVSQAYLEMYPKSVGGFISIDSCPLQRHYMTGFELWALKNVGPVYKLYPWQALLRDGAKGCAETPYGRELMKTMMESYSKDEYVALAAFGYRMLAEAVEADKPYHIDCPCILLCGEKDKAGSAKRYNKRWHEETGIPLLFIEGAGHNANTDQPEKVNSSISNFLTFLR